MNTAVTTYVSVAGKFKSPGPRATLVLVVPGDGSGISHYPTCCVLV